MAAKKRVAITIAANTDFPLPAVGNFVFVEAASTDMSLRATNQSNGQVIGDGDLVRANASHRYEEPFDLLTISNTTAAVQTAIIWTGSGRGGINQFVQLGSGTLPSTADANCGAAATTLVLAVNGARRAAVISNLAANANKMRVGDVNTGAARGIELSPGQSVTLETTGAIYAYNPAGAAQSVGLLELV